MGEMELVKEKTKLGDVLRELRDKHGISQQGLADATGGELSAGHIGLIETGKRGLGPEKVEAVIRALHATKAEAALLRQAAKSASGVISADQRVAAVETRLDQVEETLAENRKLLEALAEALRSSK